MAINFNNQLFVVSLLFALSTYVAGHSYMTTPTSRSNQAQSQSGCRGPLCYGPCDIPLSRATRAPISAARGDSIVVEWPRNNHAGGFIRFAWALTSQSDNHEAFDSHVQMITCHEIGNPTPGQCAPSNPISDPNGGGSGPGDGSSGACNTVITVPLDLTDGKWTLQWAWFGGAFSLGDYYSCTDYVISGGPVGTLTPVFKGGDFSYPNQQVCKFFNTDKLGVCTTEPCQNPLYTLSHAQVGPPANGQLGLSSSPSPSTPTVPATPVTTGSVRITPPPSNNVPTNQGTVSTTSRMMTTGSVPIQVPVPVPVPVPTTPSTPVSGNCAGATSTSSSTAKYIAIDSWGSTFHGLIEIDVHDAILSDWILEITFPFTTQITSSFNGGSLSCTQSSNSKTVAYYKPVAPWSNNMPIGSTIQVEFIAGSNMMSADYIRANTVLKVLKQ